MRICEQEEPEERQSATALPHPELPALQSVLAAADSSEHDEAQWADCLAELLLRTDGESASGCDWTDGALSFGGCRW